MVNLLEQLSLFLEQHHVIMVNVLSFYYLSSVIFRKRNLPSLQSLQKFICLLLDKLCKMNPRQAL